MNLIDCSYFYTGPLQIENARQVDDLDNNAFAVQEAITAYIERYQPEFLRLMVGGSVASLIEAHLAKASTDGYANAAVEDLCERLRLPLAHYVYFKMAGDANQHMTITGLVTLKGTNTPQPPRQRMVRVWNDMVRLNRQFLQWAEGCEFDVRYHADMVTPINQYNL